MALLWPRRDHARALQVAPLGHRVPTVPDDPALEVLGEGPDVEGARRPRQHVANGLPDVLDHEPLR